MTDLELPTVTGRFFSGTFLASHLLCDLSIQARKSLSNITRPTYFKKDSTVISERQFPGIYLHRKGRAEIIFFNRLNRRFIFQSVEPDEILGLIESVSDIPFRMTVKAVTPCLFQTIDKTEFNEFLRENPRVNFRLVKLLGNDVCKSTLFFSSTTFHDRPSSFRDSM